MKEWSPFRIDYSWEPVLREADEPFTYPTIVRRGTVTHFMCEQYSKAAIYKWLFRSPDGFQSAYIGEAGNFVQRIRDYLTRGRSRQTKQMRENILAHISSGGTVELQILRFEPFAINNVNVDHESQLRDPYIRKMMENFLLADHDSVHCELKNCVANPIERRRRKSMRAVGVAGSRLGDFSAAKAAAQDSLEEGKS